MAESYYDLLKHPEWQKKRLKVLEAAEFECATCGSKDKTLHVHHRYCEPCIVRKVCLVRALFEVCGTWMCGYCFESRKRRSTKEMLKRYYERKFATQ
jgi:hypothetical protein